MPSDVKAKQTKLCPIDTPYIQPAASLQTVFTTPGMYQSEYTQIGKGRMVPTDWRQRKRWKLLEL